MLATIAAHPFLRRLLSLVLLAAGWLYPQPLWGASGDLDCQFGVGGTIVHDLGSIEAAFDAQLQSDGKIVTLGSSGGALRLSRFLPDGDLDPTFEGSGSTVHTFSGLGTVPSVAVDSLDRILVTGAITVDPGGTDDQEVFVARFTADGAVDTTFGGGDGWNSFDFTAATADAGTEGGGGDRRRQPGSAHRRWFRRRQRPHLQP